MNWNSSKNSGLFEEVSYADQTFFEHAKEQFFRASTGIDEGSHDKDARRNYEYHWRSAGLDNLIKKVNQVNV